MKQPQAAPTMNTKYLAILIFVFAAYGNAVAQNVKYFSYSETNMSDYGGSTLDAAYASKEAFEVVAFAFAAGRAPVYGTSSPGKPGTPDFDMVEIILQTDPVAYHRLLSSMVQGTQLGEVVIEGVIQQGDQQNLVFSRMTFTNVVLTRLQIEGTEGDQLFVNVALDWEQIGTEFFRRNDDGSVSSAGPEIMFNRTNGE